MTTETDEAPAAIETIGYEGQTIEQFIECVQARGITMIVDVRMHPQSRVRGFAKFALPGQLAAVGVEYQHQGYLGVPVKHRPAIRKRQRARVRSYESFLRNDPIARGKLAFIEDLQKATARLALLCYEADAGHCHRGLLLDEFRARAALRAKRAAAEPPRSPPPPPPQATPAEASHAAMLRHLTHVANCDTCADLTVSCDDEERLFDDCRKADELTAAKGS